MDRIIYTSMTGANAAAQRQSVLAHNLANAGTNGFRAEMSTFRSVPLQGSGAGTRVFALEATSGYVDTPGPTQRTGRALDAMAMGRAWFAVQGLDGQEAYTRNGVFEVSPRVSWSTATARPCCPTAAAPSTFPRVHDHAGLGRHADRQDRQPAARGRGPRQAGHAARGRRAGARQ